MKDERTSRASQVRFMGPNEIPTNPDFHKKFFSSDKAHFWLNGYVNRQNCRIWSGDNRQTIVQLPLDPQKAAVWYAPWAEGIIGSYFCKNETDHNVTVSGSAIEPGLMNFFEFEGFIWTTFGSNKTVLSAKQPMKEIFDERVTPRSGVWPGLLDIAI